MRFLPLAFAVVLLSACGNAPTALHVVRHEDYPNWSYQEEPRYQDEELNIAYRAVFSLSRDATRELLIGHWTAPGMNLVLGKLHVFEWYNKIPGEPDPDLWYMYGEWQISGALIVLTPKHMPANLPAAIKDRVKASHLSLEYTIVIGTNLYKPLLSFSGTEFQYYLPW